MSMSRAFPKKGIRGGPGGSGRLDDFVFDVQMASKATRDAAPMAIKMVPMNVNTSDKGWFHCSHAFMSFKSVSDSL